MTARVPSVLLINPPLVLGREWVDYPWFVNLGLLHLAAVLRARGFDVGLADAFDRRGSDLYPYGDDESLLGTTVPRLLARMDEWLGGADGAVGSQTSGRGVVATVINHSPFARHPQTVPELDRLVVALRERLPDTPVVFADCHVGGMHYLHTDPMDILGRPSGPDYVCLYEPEQGVTDLVQALRDGSAPPPDAPATSRVFEPTSEVVLDDLPPPAWDLVSSHDLSEFLVGAFDRIRRTNPFRIAPDTRPVLTSRGCAFRCCFCTSNPQAGPDGPKRYRTQGVDGLRSQLTFLLEHQQVGHLLVLDDVANLRPDFDAVLALFDELGLAYDFPNGLRADRLTDAHLEAMVGHVGMLSISAETGSPRVMKDVVGKKLDLSDVTRVAKRCQTLGLPLAVHYMIGLPGETRPEMNETLSFAWRLYEQYGADPLLQASTPLPGTRLWRDGVEQGLLDPLTSPAPEAMTRRAPITTPEFRAQEVETALKMFQLRRQATSTRKVIVNLTYRCNNHCAFCAVGNRLAEDADHDTVKRYLDQHYADGVRLVDFDGGEPTLHPKHLRLIQYARDLGYREINLTTNGRVLSYAEAAKRVTRSGLTNVLISIHGSTAAVHEGLTNAPGSFDQTVGGVRNVLQHKPPEVGFGVNTTLARSNVDHLPDMAQFLFDLGVRQWTLQFLTPFGRARPEVVPEPGTAEAMVGRVLDEWTDRMSISAINLPFCLLPGHESHVLQDVLKLERAMIFVDRRQVNLFRYLEERRYRTEDCDRCMYAVVCGGFYRFDTKDVEPLADQEEKP